MSFRVGTALVAAALLARTFVPANPAVAAPTDPVRAAMAQARSLRSQGRFDEAIAVLQRAVREAPYDENLHYLLGQMMERHASPDAMVEFFSEEVRRDQKPQTSQYFWAVGLERKGDVEGALAHLRKALEIDPAHEMSQRRWGLLLERQGRPEEALEHFVEATRIHPEYKAALEDAARVAKRLGRGAQAQEYEKRAAGANPNTPRQFVYWARYLHQHGRNRDALAEVERMLAERPKDPEALRLRDEIRAAMGGTGLPEPLVAATTRPTVAGDAGERALSAAARALLVSKLSSQPPGTPAWIAYDARDPSALALARQLAAAFEEARWTVRRLAEVSFPMRPGVFLMVADHPPSDASSTVAGALEAVELGAAVASGYRAYADGRRRANTGWRGFDLEPDQDFVIAIGRRPEK